MRKLLLLFSKRTQIKYENELGDKSGILLGGKCSVNGEGVVLMLLIKAVVLFLALAGSAMCYITGFDIECSHSLVYAVSAICAAAFALASTRLSFTAAVYAVGIYYISGFVNTNYDIVVSGITAVINMSYKLVSECYKFPSVDGFAESVADRSITVPAVVILGIVVLGMILGFFVCRFMNIMMLGVITMLPLGTVLFFKGEPSLISFEMLAAAWLITAVVKFTSKYHQIKLKRQTDTHYLGDKVYYRQGCDGTAMLQSVVISVFAAVFIGAAVCVIFPSSVFDTAVPESKTKQAFDYTIRDTMIIAFSNYKNYKITSNISGGQLGFYGNASPDLETDLKVTMLPYTTDRLYFRSYIGSDYGYKKNMWDNKTEAAAYTDSSVVSSQARAIKATGVFARVVIENAALSGGTSRYMPYYTILDEADGLGYVQDDIITGSLSLGEKQTLTFYPLTNTVNADFKPDSDYEAYVYSHYLDVPEQLKLRLNALCGGEGFKKGDEELEQKINNYFQNNFEYNLKSGRLPWQTDFAEYFLFESKSGVCAHFATAATLIYRSVGIPARYVEGYCMDYVQTLEGKAVDGEDTSSWLGGLTPLSKNVVQTELSDYNAHAWVEIYKDGIGWVPTDPTPYVDPSMLELDEENDATDTLEDIFGYFGNAELRKTTNTKFFDNAARLFAVLVKIIVCIVFLVMVYFLIRPICYCLYRQSLTDGKRTAVIRFGYLKALAVYCGIAESDSAYRELAKALYASGLSQDKANRLLYFTQKAIYSRDGITKAELAELKELFKAAEHTVIRSVGVFKRIKAFFAIIK